MIKFRLYFDKDKEEKWLNRMCEEGWAMNHFCIGFYTFLPCEKGAYTYRIDMPGGVGKDSIPSEAKRDYISFVEETGAEYVCDWGWWVFFRKETAKGSFELYSDLDSQIAQYKKIRKMFLWVGLLELLIGINAACTWVMHGKDTGIWMPTVVMLLMCVIIAVFLFISIKITYRLRKLERNRE